MMNISRVERMKMGIMGELVEDDQMRVHVVAVAPNGEKVSLGSVSASLIYQNPRAAHMALERIRFPPKKVELARKRMRR